ncbi:MULTISPECIES: hypothetical protein [Sulfurimonas]|uniref:hypothetical protein n=1 Tax=Sulfurimonas TaxID=202746 RepID=UPI00125F3CB1|nr:hypothetical protein [Sulfurimonas hydrogeniphila]
MKKRLLTFVLLLSMSFNILHAYAIEVLETDPCQVSEYVHEFSNNSETADNCICQLHHCFHIAFILPEINIPFARENFSQKPYSNIKIYEFNSYDNFLKPPISA